MAKVTDTDGTIRWSFFKELDASNAVVVPPSAALLSRATSVSRLLSAAGTNQDRTIVKAAPGVLFGLKGYVARASAIYLKLYDKETNPSQVDTPVETIYLPALSAFALDYSRGLAFATGISYRLTTDAADNSTNGLTAADLLAFNVEYS